ncbi:uncharacterized protein SCHCODRAFT_02045788 [Schizophyllum commune H4-8]|uniref:uncharacterized protein n=1 Tax=Schizophyllum commune (strain H4-8 / FGSC 9210) TaxID=578458 RepID=UPI0021608946|nr:uncharacterized protein SCHCODRAFT_02045788 [Schizophyllum commune H4-8]KAI5888106.1 hypothetical protein SCHCODRAFT_02045788 [Schizophyllum commune H4-8]
MYPLILIFCTTRHVQQQRWRTRASAMSPDALTKQPRRAREGGASARRRARGNGGGGGARASRDACCGKPRPVRPGGRLPHRVSTGACPATCRGAVAVWIRQSRSFEIPE